MKKVLLILVMILVLCGCNNKEKSVYDIMKENEHIIVDVRTKEEYEELHIKDAINIPYDEIDEYVDLDKEKIIFVYCRSGRRSEIAFQTLTKLGYKVYDMGGISEIDLPKEK